ncbi:hypothetical protein K440DRAFT_659939 [Wilcoxina mikolae CBS 423.85]|nr:hypothetical protein K440DRAFT_659939 [Wilcoxina mikolae CBS 423.85]
MRPPRIHVDSLQRCLCPRLARPFPSNVAFLKPIVAFSARLQSTSSSSSAAAAAAVAAAPSLDVPPIRPPPPSPSQAFVRRILAKDKESPSPSPSPSPLEPPSPPPPSPPPPSPPPPNPYTNDPTPMEHIISLAQQEKTEEALAAASQYVSTGSLSPSLELYNVLMSAAAGARHDSMKSAAFQLLAEMKTRGIQPNAPIYYSLLRLLAKSPDYLRRAEVLQEMQQRWFALNDEAWAWVVQGYIKDRQMELAVDMVLEREGRGFEVGNAVYRDLIAGLTQVGEVNEALRILVRIEGVDGERYWKGTLKQERRKKMWFDLLLVAARDMRYETTKYTWNKIRGAKTLLPLFNPPTGLCDIVLNCAARYGDAALAEDVVGYLNDSEIPLHEHHYAAQIEAYALSTPPNVPKIFSTLASMHAADIPPHKHTARAALPILSSSRTAADSAAAALAPNNTNPLASVELVMAAYTQLPDLAAAMQIYTSLPTLTSAKPTTHTVNILLSGCADAKNSELAMYLVAEMRAMHVRPDAASYDALVRVCSPKQEAFLYLEEMKAAGFRAARRTYVDLITTCVNAGDRERAEMVMKEMAEVDWESDGVTRRLLRQGRA